MRIGAQNDQSIVCLRNRKHCSAFRNTVDEAIIDRPELVKTHGGIMLTKQLNAHRKMRHDPIMVYDNHGCYDFFHRGT